jgi:WD40 repeat protein
MLLRRQIKYLSAFCCGLLAIFFLGQVMAITPPDSLGLKQSTKNPITAVTTIAFSPDGKTLATGGEDSQIVLFDAESGRQKLTLKGHGGLPVTKLAFNPKGGKLASVGRDTVLRIWDTEKGEQTQSLTGHENPTRAVAYSLEGKYLASAGEDSAIALWNGDKLLQIFRGHRDFVNDIAFSPDGTILASGAEDDRIILWNVASGKQGFTLRGHADGVTGVAFSPNGKLLASASKDGTVRLWDAATGIQRQILKGPTKRLTAVAFSPSGKVLAAAGEDDYVFLWDADSGKPRESVAKNKASKTTTVVFNPVDENSLVTGDQTGEISFLDVAQAKKNISIQFPAKGVEQKSLKSQKSDNSLKKAAVSSSNKTLLAAIPSPPGGPVLIVTSTSNHFSEYYAEILRNEGLNYFSVSDISSISSATLNNYDVVILSETSLTPGLVTIFSDWVNSGGNLIAMRPDKQLASLLGLTDAGSTLSNGYLLPDTSKFPGNGIVSQTIQFHGVSDRYTRNSASSLATLYSNATTQTSNPAVTLHNVGLGQAATFTFDLARSIVYTRQGNPAWASQERDSFSPIRSDDQFYGAASFDSQSDWVDLNKVSIPQADEQQRLLANLILTMNSSKKPLPRFWYFPNGKKAVVLMTGDDHANNGTAGRFDQFIQQSPAGCNPDNWECIRGTSYIYPNTPITDSQVAAYNSQGFEISLHLNTGCDNFTASSLSSFYTQQLSQFSSNYPSLPTPVTQRHHCLVWSDWSSTPEVELSKGMRLDTTYYYWPPIWVLDRPGFFTGSGMPMRFAKTDGTAIDVYNATTQITDESGQSYPYTIDTLLNLATGSDGYYGVLNVNAHTDINGSTSQSISDGVVSAAKARGVPVISARQLLTWLDGRNNSSFDSLSWNSSSAQLSFSITKGGGANGLQALLPTRSADRILSGITRNSSPVTYTVAGIKGIEYAIFSGDAGSYVASYTPSSPPELIAISPTSPANGATGIGVGSSVIATFTQAMNPATINTSSFELRDSANTVVGATITYDAATRTAKLEPNGNLALNTTYTATLKGGGTIKNQVSAALAANYTWSFTTAGLPCPQQQQCQIWSNSSTPTNPSVNDPNSVELGVKFRSDLDGYISGIRFYKGSQNTGTHVGTLWSSSGQQLSTATFSNESANGWQQVSFPTPVQITSNTVYVASYHTTVGGYAADNNFFASSGIDNPPLHALSENASGGNGVYRYSSTPIFPDSSYQSSNYWVDVLFTTSTPAQIPPTVSSITPINTTTGISTGTTIKANFSKAMNLATISTSTFELRDSNNTLVASTVTYDTTSNKATLSPNAVLAANTNYTATIKGGSSGVKDQAGNSLNQDYTCSFTTGSGITIWDKTESPSILTDTETQAVELGLKFKSDINGYIKGISFYKSTSNTGIHVGTLWSSTGTALATATFTNETASGWQEASFPTPVAITANTDYVASYHTNVGRYSKTENFFTNSGVNRPPLRALQNGVNGGNGVYQYSSTTSVFPTSTYLSTNYWVDVIFSTTNP